MNKAGAILLTVKTVLTVLVATLLVLTPGAVAADDATIQLGVGDSFVVQDSGATPRLIVDGTTGTVQIDDAEIAGGIIAGPPNQGDLWYDNGSGVTRLAPGAAGQFLQTLGVAANPAWASAGLRNQAFLASGTFTAPPGVTLVFLFMVGGGGAGGSGAVLAGGSGGGAGGMVVGRPYLVIPGGNYAVRVGLGGPFSGNSGGPSSFEEVVAPRGIGGENNGSATPGGGGFDGSGSQGGGISLQGGSGAGALGNGGGGGGTLFGPGGNGSSSSAGFAAAVNSGGGGGGGGIAFSGVPGGAGGSGVVVVLY